jgi:hypothetical protein
MTARFNLGFLLCVSIACGSDDGSGSGSSSSDGSSGASASATDPDTTVTATVTDPDTTVTVTATDTQADSSTTDPTASTTTDPTQGDDSTGGSSTDATGSSTDATGLGSSSTDATGLGSSSDTGVMPAAGYGDCVNNPEARVCIDGEICALDPDGQLGFCTLQGCTDEGDCPSVSSGNPTVLCIDANQDMVQDCMLSCSMGETCPDGMICVFDAFCVWQA